MREILEHYCFNNNTLLILSSSVFITEREVTKRWRSAYGGTSITSYPPRRAFEFVLEENRFSFVFIVRVVVYEETIIL